MPNFCNNTLVATFFSPEEAEAFKQSVKKTGLLETLKPMPEEVKDTTVGNHGFDMNDERGWYGWACNHWGTKWSEGILNIKRTKNKLRIEYETAWCPPTEALEALQTIPGFKRAFNMYNEAGCDFIGYTLFNWEAGLDEDHCYDMSEVLTKYGAPEWDDQKDNDDDKYWITHANEQYKARNTFFKIRLGEDMGTMGLGG